MNCPADSVGGATASMSLSSYADISSPDAPRPVQIVVAKPDHTFDLDHEALQVGTCVAGSISFFGLKLRSHNRYSLPHPRGVL